MQTAANDRAVQAQRITRGVIKRAAVAIHVATDRGVNQPHFTLCNEAIAQQHLTVNIYQVCAQGLGNAGVELAAVAIEIAADLHAIDIDSALGAKAGTKFSVAADARTPGIDRNLANAAESAAVAIEAATDLNADHADLPERAKIIVQENVAADLRIVQLERHARFFQVFRGQAVKGQAFRIVEVPGDLRP